MSTSTTATLTTCCFDLDDTLYPRAAGVMRVVTDRIGDYLRALMGLDADEVFSLRRRFYEQYGTALRGLQVEHPDLVDPEDFLRSVHDIDYSQLLSVDPSLDAALTAIPLNKVIFTNSSREHAEGVLASLGIRKHFSRIVDIRDCDFLCKPHVHAYKRMLSLVGAPAEAVIFVEDTPRNLRPARELGMTTVLVDPTGAETEASDYMITHVTQIGDLVARIMADAPQASGAA